MFIKMIIFFLIKFNFKKNCLGGYYVEKCNAVDSFEGLKKALEDSFELKEQLNMPMFIRETKRKFQFTVCLVSIWQRK